jgi:hypothetical protein
MKLAFQRTTFRTRKWGTSTLTDYLVTFPVPDNCVLITLNLADFTLPYSLYVNINPDDASLRNDANSFIVGSTNNPVISIPLQVPVPQRSKDLIFTLKQGPVGSVSLVFVVFTQSSGY